MTRVVALEEGLEELGEYLKGKGYTVVPWNQPNVAVDAVIYTGRKLDEAYTNTNIQVQSPMAGDMNGSFPYGVLLVNAQGRTPEEVYEIVRNRVYEHFI